MPNNKNILLAGSSPSTNEVIASILGDSGHRIFTLVPGSEVSNTLAANTITDEQGIPVSIKLEDGSCPNAAVFHVQSQRMKKFLDIKPSDWDEAVDSDFVHNVFLAKAVARQMIDSGVCGSIVFIGGFEMLLPFAGYALSGSMMAMLSAVVKMAAVDLAPHGIRVNMIAAGWTTDSVNSLPTVVQNHILSGTPSGKLIDFHEIAALVLFLVQDGSQSITGTVIPLDGGYSLTRSVGRSALSP